ncbi:MAG TPA: DUF4190 domain-containing protein [Polyangiaceae bacterium]|jgi:hypothetical protein|nr:DUF4190 domain-containing protein [Polyangiaceae bacterium]
MHSPPVGAPWAPHERTKTNGTSIFALLASVFSFVCFLGLGGVLGVVLGLIARKEIARSEGRETGRGLANAAIVIGALNLCSTVVALAIAITYIASPRPVAKTRSAPIIPPPAWTASPGTIPHPTRAPAAPEARASREMGTQVTTLGAITLADISGDFEAELDKQRSAAEASSETLILWLVVPDCKPCNGVAAALTSPIAQKALAKVRFVRVDRNEFQVELERLSIPTEKIPGFVLLDGRNHPRDFIHGGEWDADIAPNIAPVLGKFAHGSYPRRRHPWHGAAREDETPI